MKKDLQSYEKHNKGYQEDTSYYTKEAIVKRTEESNDFKRTGFELALSITKELPKVHVDIGSGVGWLVRKMSPYFSKSYGIELSHAAVESAKRVTEELPNVSFLEDDMIDGYKKLALQEPVFFTTGAVLSHIENYYVIEFLKLLNEAPLGSVLFFSENYDRNINWAMWHIRSKEWWRKQLSQWQLVFLDIENGGYASGIYGIKNVAMPLPPHTRTTLWTIYWVIDYTCNLLNRIIKKVLRIFK